MSQPAADRNLLFGVLAMQMDFINREQLITAMQAWVFDKGKPLGEILVAQKALDVDNRTLLDALVQKHLAKHGGDAEKSLAAISSAGHVRKDLERIADADVQASLIHMPTEKPKPADPWATVAPTPGMIAASGMRFRIVRPHARGGLGEVFVARDEELNREVALKEIQEPQADNPESRTRFMLEAEITGGLEHPGIVPVYGLGSYADGRPYYAMRFIRGDSLKEAIERFHKSAAAGMSPGERTLALRSLLGRLVDVCNAIAYAHSRGVLHRDLKPGNIMLGKYGETLVVDWGLAKPLGQAQGTEPSLEPGEGSLMPTSMSAASATIVGAAVGTPQYMSPEQAGGRLDQLGPASDVYSIGATLYCILTGKSPISESDVGTVLHKVQRGDFPRPREIKSDVSPALEAICMKAMALKPQDRYATPKQMGDDIEHWLADEPVSAWKEPWTVTARRWIGRHATLVTSMGSAVAVALIGLIIATVLLTAANERERKAREYAEQKEKEAAENFKMAKAAVDRYHTDVSENVILEAPHLKPLRKKLLEAAREFYDKFAQKAVGDQKVAGEFGKATYRLAQITADIESEAKGIALHEKAAKIFEALPPVKDGAQDFRGDQAACYHHLGRLHRNAENAPKSGEYYLKAQSLWEQLLKDQPKNERYLAGLARTQNGLGNHQRFLIKLEAAPKYFEQSLATWQKLIDAHPKSPEYQRGWAVAKMNLGLAYRGLGIDEEADKAYDAALDVQKKLVNDEPHVSQYHADLARTLRNRADLYANTNPPPKVAAAYKEAANTWKTLADRHPEGLEYQTNLAETYTTLSLVYVKAFDPTSAADACAEALAIQRKLAKEQDDAKYQAGLARALVALGEVLRSSDKYGQAESAFSEALAIQENLARDPTRARFHQRDLARTFDSLGVLHAENKNEAKAVAAYKRALSAWETLTKENPGEEEFAMGLSGTYYKLGALAAMAKNPKEAVDRFTQALTCFEGIGIRNLQSVDVKRALRFAHGGRAEMYTQMGKFGDSVEDWKRVLELTAESSRRPYLLPYAAALARAGKHAEAVQELEPLVKLATAPDSQYRFACVYALAAAAAEGDVARSEAERRQFADRHADRAMKMLSSVRAAGYFKTANNLKKLHNDPDLTALRGRADFKKLVAEFKAP